MHDSTTIIAIVLALWMWPKVLLGLTYLVREARVFDFVRAPLVLKFSWFAHLVGCGQCTSLWTGMIAFVMLWSVVYLICEIPVWSIALVPIFGIAGTGTFDRLARSSISMSVDRLTRVLMQIPPESEKHDAG